MFMLGFPLLLIPFAIYNIIAFLMPGVAWSGVVSTVHMMSGVDWTMTTGDVLVALAILLLCGEVMKSSRISQAHHLRSRIVVSSFPRHVDRIYSRQTGRHHDIFPAPRRGLH